MLKWIFKLEIKGYDSFRVYDVHEDEKILHRLDVLVLILMINIVPVIVKEEKHRG